MGWGCRDRQQKLIRIQKDYCFALCMCLSFRRLRCMTEPMYDMIPFTHHITLTNCYRREHTQAYGIHEQKRLSQCLWYREIVCVAANSSGLMWSLTWILRTPETQTGRNKWMEMDNKSRQKMTDRNMLIWWMRSAIHKQKLVSKGGTTYCLHNVICILLVISK